MKKYTTHAKEERLLLMKKTAQLAKLVELLDKLERLMLDIDNRINECEHNISMLASEVLGDE